MIRIVIFFAVPDKSGTIEVRSICPFPFTTSAKRMPGRPFEENVIGGLAANWVGATKTFWGTMTPQVVAAGQVMKEWKSGLDGCVSVKDSRADNDDSEHTMSSLCASCKCS